MPVKSTKIDFETSKKSFKFVVRMKLFLIDGHALIFKMYYAFLRRPMVNSKGADVSILYGFTKYVLELIEKEKPTNWVQKIYQANGWKLRKKEK